MKFKTNKHWMLAGIGAGILSLAINLQAQTVTNLNPNQIISWSFDQYGFVNAVGGSGLPVTNSEAGLAAAYNWNDSWAENNSTYPMGTPVTVNGLFDNTGTATIASLNYNSYNGYHVQASNPTQDANGTYNRDMLNGFLNAGPAAWGPSVTNTYVSLTNVPYARYDVVIYFNSDTSGRHASIDNGATTYYFSTMGSSAISGTNALFVPTTQTNSDIFPGADFAFFPNMTNTDAIFTETPKSGNDQWLGIAAFQVIQASSVYVLYGPAPANQTIPVGQPASFSVMAGGLNPTYQWRHAGTNIDNATNATYTIAATSAGQDGDYDVIISNSFGSVTSVVATLTLYTPNTLTWAGNGSTWDTSSLFWTTDGGVTTTNYAETDNVRFDPFGSGQSAVSLADQLTPSSITVSNASYTFVSGSLAGSGSLHLMNNATLILDTADTSTGPTLIDDGSILQLDNGDTAGSLGSGALTNNGGLVFNANGDDAYGYPIYGAGSITNVGSSGTITLANNVSANYLVQAGGGTLLLQGSNSLSGGLEVSSGTVWARAVNCLGSAPVTVSGGELQLIFDIDFAGANIVLAGGVLHGGVGGNNSYDGAVTLLSDSQINVDSGDSFTLNNASGISASDYNLYVGDSGTLILAGTNNTWSSLNITLSTVQIGNGGSGSLGAGPIDDAGVLAFDIAGNLMVSNSIADIGGINQNGSGTVFFTGDLSGLSGTTVVAAGGLGGATTFGGPVNVLPGGTLVPGTPSTIGTLTINSDLTLGGNVAVKLDKSLSQSNDLVVVTGSLSDTNSGVVTVNNLGPALVAGDKFTLFNQPVAGGENFAVIGGGVTWSNNLANDGSIIVLSTAAAYPTNIACSVSDGMLSLSWPATHRGWILQYQTNSLSAGLSTNWVDVPGSASMTTTNIPINPNVPSVFYRLRSPN